MKLNGRTVLVTGGTSGIGLALVELLKHRCKNVLVLARNKQALASLSRDNPNIHGYVCHLEQLKAVELMADKLIREFPDLSVIFNNAGIQNFPTFLADDFNFDGIEHEVKINLISPIWITGLFLGHLVEQQRDGAFVNVTSGLALFPKRTSAVYCATKAGLRHFSKSLRYQLEGTQVKVFEGVMPMVDTAMTRGRGKKKLSPQQAAEALVAGIEANSNEIYIGMARWIPWVSRLSPGLMSRILKRG